MCKRHKNAIETNARTLNVPRTHGENPVVTGFVLDKTNGSENMGSHQKSIACMEITVIMKLKQINNLYHKLIKVALIIT